MAKWQFTRPGTWDYPTLGFRATTGDVIEASAAPDQWWDAADPGATVTIPIVPGAGVVEDLDGSILVYNAATNRDERKLPEDAGLLTPASADARSVARRRSGELYAAMTDPFGVRLLPSAEVMTAPPTITYGTTYGSSTITSAVTLLPTDSRVRRLGLGDAAWTTFVSGAFTYHRAFATQAYSYAVYEFSTDAPKIEINMFGIAYWNLEVDGRMVSTIELDSSKAPASKANGNRYFTALDFGSRRKRDIRIVGRQLDIAGILVGPNDTVWHPNSPSGPRYAVLGDSYGMMPHVHAARRLGFREVIASCVGGTGYLNDNSTYTTFRERLSDIINANPDIAFLAGGLNDKGRQTKAVLQAEVKALVDELRAAHPDVYIVALGPWCPNGANATSADYTDVRDAIRDALATDTGRWAFIDNLTGAWVASDGRTGSTGGTPWQTGSGKAGALTGSGNGDLYLNADGTHPTNATTTSQPQTDATLDGTRYLATRISDALADALGLN